jgi:hypothetical protein
MTLDGLRAYRLVYVATPYTLAQDGLDRAAERAIAVEAALVADGIKAYKPVYHLDPITMDIR